MKIGDRTCFGDNFSSPLNLIQARCRSGGGLSSAVHRAAFASARTLPPPRRSGLRIHPSLRSAVICSVRRPRSRLGNPARLRRSGGRRRFALSAAREPRCAPLETRSARAFVRSAYARLHPRPGNGGDAVPATHRQPAAARVARDSLCLPGKVPHRLRRGRCAPKLSCRILRRQPLAVVLRFARTRALLWPLPALTLATGQVFTADHASFFAGNCHCQGKQPPPDIRPSLRSDVDLLWPLSALPLATGQAFTIASRSLPGERRASKHFCQTRWPIR